MDTFVCRCRKHLKSFSPRSGGSGVTEGKYSPLLSQREKYSPPSPQRGKYSPHSLQRGKYSSREEIFPIEGKFPSLGNRSSFGNIFLFCELFIFRENIHPVGKYSHMGTFLTFTRKFPNGDKLDESSNNEQWLPWGPMSRMCDLDRD